MRSIDIKVNAVFDKSSQEICLMILDTERWPEFKGYLFLPGIESAHFEKKTNEIVGSKIKVQNSDGSSHTEEIIEWNDKGRIALRFYDFNSPLKNFSSHFIEVWEFTNTNSGTAVTRKMSMYPKNLLGRLLLVPISFLMKRAFEKNLIQLGSK